MSRPGRAGMRRSSSQVRGESANQPDAGFRDFADRFGLGIDLGPCRDWFVTWARNHLVGDPRIHAAPDSVAFGLASRVGMRYAPPDATERMLKNMQHPRPSFEKYLPNDFMLVLRSLEYLYSAVPSGRDAIDRFVDEGLRTAPCDLQVRWEAGRFLPATVEILDRQLIGAQLAFLRSAGLSGAAEPFDQALRALLDGRTNPARFKDAVRNAYEAVEYAAKRVTGRDRDLSANRDILVARAELSTANAALLRHYIEFGNDYRHADSLEGLPAVEFNRAEEFIFHTAIILRAVAASLPARSQEET